MNAISLFFWECVNIITGELIELLWDFSIINIHIVRLFRISLEKLINLVEHEDD